MTTIAARQGYTPPSAPSSYNPGWLREQLATIARAIAPEVTRTVKAATTITAADKVVLCDATAGPFTVTFQPASQQQFLTVTVKKIDASANAVTLGGTFDGAANPTLATQYKSKTVVSDGVNWYVLATV